MSELHKFLFDGLPVRGMLVRLTDSWQEVLHRHRHAGGYPAAVAELLGEMAAAGVLMQGNIKFNGALVMQVFGDGPVQLAVAEVQPDFAFRATAKVTGEVTPGMPLSQMLNASGKGRCAITLDPKDRLPGQQPYQGVVPLSDAQHRPIESLAGMLEHYMLQSEQLDTRLVLAADEHTAAGLLIQRLPATGEANLSGTAATQADEDEVGRNEDYNRIALLAASLKREELLGLDADTILHRLFWQEKLLRLLPSEGTWTPRFACSCSRERVAGMLQSLGAQEVEDTLAEQGRIEVACDFCGMHYHFDAVDAAQLFLQQDQQPPGPSSVQ